MRLAEADERGAFIEWLYDIDPAEGNRVERNNILLYISPKPINCTLLTLSDGSKVVTESQIRRIMNDYLS